MRQSILGVLVLLALGACDPAIDGEVSSRLSVTDAEAQDRRAARQHQRAAEGDRTCIECHYGLVHEEPDNATAIMEQVIAEHSNENEPGD